MAGGSVLRPRRCSQPRIKSCPEKTIIFCKKLLVRRKVPGWNLYSTQSQNFLNFSDIGCDELRPWRGLWNCVTDYSWWALQYATDIEVEGQWKHEMPIKTATSEWPSCWLWQGQQRGSTQDNMVVKQLQGFWLQLPFAEDCRPGRAIKSVLLIHTERKAAKTCFPLNLFSRVLQRHHCFSRPSTDLVQCTIPAGSLPKSVLPLLTPPRKPLSKMQELTKASHYYVLHITALPQDQIRFFFIGLLLLYA